MERQSPGLSVTVIGIAKEKTKKVQGKSVKESVFMPIRVPDKQLEKHVVLLFWCEKKNSLTMPGSRTLTAFSQEPSLKEGRPIFVSVVFRDSSALIYYPII